ncbi:MAG: hypothetical protein ACKOXM_02360 [Agromyces sp.]
MSESRITLPDLWGPWRWPARVVLAAFAIAQLFLAITAIVQFNDAVAIVFAFACFLSALVLLSHHWGSELPSLVVGAVVFLVLAMTVAQSDLAFTAPERADDWYLGAAVSVLMVLIMWGRTTAAWLAFVALSAIQIIVSLSLGIGLDVSLAVLLRHAGTMLATWFTAYSVARLARQLSDTATRRRGREATDAVRWATETERAEQFRRLDRIAGWLLRRITEGTALTAAERDECVLVEATLRDTMSGRAWATRDVLVATRAARARGVHVTLLDDSEGVHGDIAHATDTLIETLAGMPPGRCTARLLPAGREHAASIHFDVDGSGGEVLQIGHRAE